MKYVVDGTNGTNAAKYFGYFPAYSAVVMLKIEARSVCTRTRDCSSALATNNKKNNNNNKNNKKNHF